MVWSWSWGGSWVHLPTASFPAHRFTRGGGLVQPPAAAHGSVDLWFSTTWSRHQVEAEGEQGGFGCLGIVLPDLGGGGDGAGIERRIAGNAAHRIEADGVEGFSGVLHTHLGMHGLATLASSGRVSATLPSRRPQRRTCTVSDRSDHCHPPQPFYKKYSKEEDAAWESCALVLNSISVRELMEAGWG